MATLTKPACGHCGDTGDMTGSGYLDYPHCVAAVERAELESWATRRGYPLRADIWAIYQHGKAAGANASGLVCTE